VFRKYIVLSVSGRKKLTATSHQWLNLEQVAGIHRKIHLGVCKDPDARYIGKKLKDLRPERNDAAKLCEKLDSIDRTALNRELEDYARIKGDLRT
jgi:hypothetical protein